MSVDHPNCRAVDAALEAAGVPGRVRLLAEAAPTAAAAAAQLDCPVGAIANSLIFTDSDDRPVLVMTSGAHRVDTSLVGDLLGTRLRRADAAFVRTHTSQPIGGVAPVGHPEPLRTVVDQALGAHQQLWAAGGIPHAIVPLTFAELVRLTGGTVAVVASD